MNSIPPSLPDLSEIDFNDDAHRRAALACIHELIDYMEVTVSKLQKGDIHLNEIVLEEMLFRFQRDLGRLDDDPDPYKKAGCITFWAKKLKPLVISNDNTQVVYLIINEIFALYLGLGYLPKVKISADLLEDFIIDLRYRAMSPHSIMYMFKALCNNSVPL